MVATFVLFFIFAVQNILDIYTTNIVLTKYHGAELNPFVKCLMSKIGVLPALVLSKVALLSITLLTILKYIAMDYKLSFFGLFNVDIATGLIMLIILYMVVLYNNFTILSKERRIKR